MCELIVWPFGLKQQHLGREAQNTPPRPPPPERKRERPGFCWCPRTASCRSDGAAGEALRNPSLLPSVKQTCYDWLRCSFALTKVDCQWLPT